LSVLIVNHSVELSTCSYGNFPNGSLVCYTKKKQQARTFG